MESLRGGCNMSILSLICDNDTVCKQTGEDCSAYYY